MLQSPFPGMDPYLEIDPRWQAIHGWFIRLLASQNQERARDLGCWIGVERTVYQRVGRTGHGRGAGRFERIGCVGVCFAAA
jgi:hypothetical protein